MIGLTVWCAMMIGISPVYVEGMVLTQSVSFYTVRFNKDILAVRKTSCLHYKPKGIKTVPFIRRKK